MRNYLRKYGQPHQLYHACVDQLLPWLRPGEANVNHNDDSLPSLVTRLEWRYRQLERQRQQNVPGAGDMTADDMCTLAHKWIELYVSSMRAH